MSIETQEGALGPYLRAIRSHARVVVAITLAAVVGSVAWLSLRSKTYEATAQLIVSPLPQGDTAFLGVGLLRDSGDPTRTVQTAATLVDSASAAGLAATRLGQGWTGPRVQASTSVNPAGQSNVLDVIGRAATPAEAARVANVFALAALNVRRKVIAAELERAITQTSAELAGLPASSPLAVELGGRLAELRTVSNGRDPTIAFSQRALPPSSATGASAALLISLALLAGFVLATGTAVFLELVNPKIRDEDEALAIYGLPVLARVPALPRRRRGRSSAEPVPRAVREGFRSLRVQLAREHGRHRVVMITSPSESDGKSTSVINFALSLAEAGKRVVLIDLDLRKPSLASTLQVSSNGAGPAQLGGDERLAELLVPVPGIPLVNVLPGNHDADGSTLESVRRQFPKLRDEALSIADYVIIDTASLGQVSDALLIAGDVDDVIAVVRPRNTRRVHLEVMRDLFERATRAPTGFLVIGGSDASEYHSGYRERGGQ